jgi:hypothetical protein
MNVSRARIAIPFLALALLAGPALTGCSSTALAEGVFEGVAGENGQEIDLNTDGGLPEGFPEYIPVIDGAVVLGTSIGEGADIVITVQVAIDDPKAAFDTINAQLLEAGFTTDFSGIREEDGTGYGTYDDGKHNVTLSTGTESADGQMVATYLISATTR